MKFFRLATLYFEQTLNNWHVWKMLFDDIEVFTLANYKIENQTKLLVAAKIDIFELPKLTDEGHLDIQKIRKQAEHAIESAANLISVSENCKRTISSPTPCVAFLPETKEHLDWLDKTNGFSSEFKPISGGKTKLHLKDNIEFLTDRLDGVALLSEALANNHSTGKFHEFLRLFERAFSLSASKLVHPLSEFLEFSDLNYSTDEVKKWVVNLRHPATHADKKDYFVLESDVLHIIPRMEQAAYYVLLNKKLWRSPSIEHRKCWKPISGPLSPTDNSVFVTQNTDTELKFKLLDPFSAYPIDLSSHINSLPAGWWSK